MLVVDGGADADAGGGGDGGADGEDAGGGDGGGCSGVREHPLWALCENNVSVKT